MIKDIRWGILATGWIADLFTRDLLLAGCKVGAVGSRRVEAAEAFADKPAGAPAPTAPAAKPTA